MKKSFTPSKMPQKRLGSWTPEKNRRRWKEYIGKLSPSPWQDQEIWREGEPGRREKTNK